MKYVDWFSGNTRVKLLMLLLKVLIVVFCNVSNCNILLAQQAVFVKCNSTQSSLHFHCNELNTHCTTDEYKLTSIPKCKDAGRALRVTGYVSLGLCAALVVTGVTLATKPVNMYTPGVAILSAGVCMGGISIPLLVIGKRKSVTNFKP